MERTGAIDVYFEEQVEILVADPEEFSVDTASEVLTELELEFSEIEVSL